MRGLSLSASFLLKSRLKEIRAHEQARENENLESRHLAERLQVEQGSSNDQRCQFTSLQALNLPFQKLCEGSVARGLCVRARA